MIGCLRTCVLKQPIIALYFEFETVLKFYNLEAWSNLFSFVKRSFAEESNQILGSLLNSLISLILEEQADLGISSFFLLLLFQSELFGVGIQ